jgi:hypothetical protein
MSRHELAKIAIAFVLSLITVLVIEHYSHTYSQVEMAWTIAGMVGFIFAAANLYDAGQDKLALMKLDDDSPRTRALLAIARAGERQEGLRMLKMGIIIALGVISGVQPPPLTDAQREKLGIPIWTTSSIIITAGLLGIVGIILIQILLDRRLRKKFYGRPRETKKVFST